MRAEPRAAPVRRTPNLLVWGRWAWRQLTSMRVALLLLLLLAVVAVPGSLFPQRPQDPVGVLDYQKANPTLGKILQALGMFDVYGSVWFAAVYLLLFLSLIGCIIPRIAVHWRALRSDPPAVPSRLTRFGAHTRRATSATPEEVLAQVASRLKRRYRVRVSERGLSAERGYLRESGNIVFHIALVGVLLSFAYGQLATYRGQVLVIEGGSFANSVLNYDSFEAGSLVNNKALTPFRLTLHKMETRFTPAGRPEHFGATVEVAEPGRAPYRTAIYPNEPLRTGSAAVYLSGTGYAPLIEVRDSAGKIAFSGPVPFLVQDDFYTSRGVLKVPDVSTGPQLGFTGQFVPTAQERDGKVYSVHPQPANPVLLLFGWEGNLGLDDGVPRNVYQLETAKMTEIKQDGKPLLLALTPGQSVELPGGRGTVTFQGIARFAALDLRHDPSLQALLWTSLAAMIGLMGSLFVPRRRLWVRAVTSGGVTWVEAAALARGEDANLAEDVDYALKGLDTGRT